jgi:diguanylate cyclase (GGDEF)-like protein/PAS domain S-box-containing protein
MTAAPAKILVVDDDATARVLMRAALRKSGFEVTLAESGQAGVLAFNTGTFDMVMLDVDMPDMTGHEVCTLLRAQADPLLPIVMVTGLDDVESVEKAYLSGATDFIAKPINWALLGHRVKYLLRGQEALHALRAADARTSAILRAVPDLLFELDIDGRYIHYHSPRSQLHGVPTQDVIGRTVAEVLPPDAARACMQALRMAHEKGASTGQQFELQHEHGAFWYELSVSRKDNGPTGKPHFIVLSRDITERKDAERKIARLAFFDSLTGLPNRLSFVERVDREIRRAKRSGDKLGILFMDLDGFKSINDTMGHSAGDLALQWAAERLRQGVRPADFISRTFDDSADASEVELARLGGDEFTALILDIHQPQDALVVAHRILQVMRRPFMLHDREVMLTASVGIALYPQDGEDAATLLKHADTAMYLAKDLGRNNSQFYSASLTETALKRMALESDLRLALEREEFYLVYQPQYDVASGRISSVEALIRWKRPRHGNVSPAEFIAVAEHCGLIVPMGQWVLRTACLAAAQWQRAGYNLRMAVNLSPQQFKDPQLVQMVTDTLAQTGLRPELLELEITEGALMEDSVATMATLNAFRVHGVQIALDDFGTGYSSLSYLKRMPLSSLKIDQSFVTGLPGDAENLAIVRAILAMANSLGLSVTAEGVETLAQAQCLRDLNCEFLQGFFFSQGIGAAEIPALLRQRLSLSDVDQVAAVLAQ